jgi:hypothetical protein
MYACEKSVKVIVDTLIRDGKIVRPVLGISYLESKQARALGIEKGVLVLDVPVNSAAYKAGLRGTKRTDSGEYSLVICLCRFRSKDLTNLRFTLQFILIRIDRNR